MRNGTCTSCGNQTIRAARNGVAFASSTGVGLRRNLEPGFRGAVWLHQTDLWTFACTTCGKVEWFLLDPEGLAYVQEHWLPVPAEQRPPPPGGPSAG